jgi:hypothetical protein
VLDGSFRHKTILFHEPGARGELLLVGRVQVMVGAFAILGLVLVDRSEVIAVWAALGTWVWVGAFGIILISGLALVLRSRVGPGRPSPA